MVQISKEHMQSLYDRLGVTLQVQDIAGESTYQPMLEETVQSLIDQGVATRSDGAVVVFSPTLTDREGNPAPLLIQKRDGGFPYAATDFAALRHRVSKLQGQRLIYVTDSRQAQHFSMIFEASACAGWTADSQIEHVPFGTVLGEDGTPFKTREGSVIALSSLIDEAVTRAKQSLAARHDDWSAEQIQSTAEAIGIGALKYADLSNARHRDYSFSYDRMLSLQGNTAPYLQYAHVRAQNIAQKAGPVEGQKMMITQPAEHLLASKALEFSAAVHDAADRLEPHRLCTYLYELSEAYASFYEQCPVIRAADPATRESRLALSMLTSRVLDQGLELLGIETVPAM
jgi:arginyl-tRNA synthetase